MDCLGSLAKFGKAIKNGIERKNWLVGFSALSYNTVFIVVTYFSGYEVSFKLFY